jgi:hypothetical protein
MVYSEMMKFTDIKSIIRPEMICIDNAVGRYFLPNNWHEYFCFGVGNDCCVDLPAYLK